MPYFIFPFSFLGCINYASFEIDWRSNRYVTSRAATKYNGAERANCKIHKEIIPNFLLPVNSCTAKIWRCDYESCLKKELIAFSSSFPCKKIQVQRRTWKSVIIWNISYFFCISNNNNIKDSLMRRPIYYFYYFLKLWKARIFILVALNLIPEILCSD